MNRLSKKSRFGLLILILLAIITFASITGLAQFETPPGKMPVTDITDSMIINYEKLKIKFGENKEMPSGYEKQILYALSYFPELAHTKIKFEIKKSRNGIIATRPSIGSLLRKGSKRTYLVIIYDSTDGRTLPAFSNCDVNGQVGILGHELCHIVYFNSSTGFGLLGLGIAHISKNFMDRFEYKTDSMDIERGLGYQLIAWKQYLYNGFKAMSTNDSPMSEKPGISQRYMSIEQVRRAMAKSKLYQ
jgi:hypothetical protein